MDLIRSTSCRAHTWVRAGCGSGIASAKNSGTQGRIRALLRVCLPILAGSVDYVAEAFNWSGPPNLVYQAGVGKQRTWRQREFSLFFQDDYKVSPVSR